MDDSVRRLIFEAIDGTISPEDFERLQSAIEQSDEVRDEYLRAVGLCEELADIALVQPSPELTDALPEPIPRPEAGERRGRLRWWNTGRLAVALALILSVGAAYWFGRHNSPGSFVADGRGFQPRCRNRRSGHCRSRDAAAIGRSEMVRRNAGLAGGGCPPRRPTAV